MKPLPLVLLIAGCLSLSELSRDVLQAQPQRVERVTAIEWCADHLQRTTRVLIDGKPVGEPVTTETLWPRGDRPAWLFSQPTEGA